LQGPIVTGYVIYDIRQEDPPFEGNIPVPVARTLGTVRLANALRTAHTRSNVGINFAFVINLYI
jgi:hypothetical protein